MNKAVFIDRDGVINKDLHGYVVDPKDFEFLPGSIEALKKLQKIDYKLIIVTNQSGIGKGLYTKDDLIAVHNYMLSLLKREGIKLDAIYYCPHSPEENCNCRKPATGMLERAVKDFNIDPTSSFMIGDKTSDIKAGKDMKCYTFLVLTGHGGKEGTCDTKPDEIVDNFLEATKKILKYVTINK